MKNNIYISDDTVGKKGLRRMKMEFFSLMLDKSALYTNDNVGQTKNKQNVSSSSSSERRHGEKMVSWGIWV